MSQEKIEILVSSAERDTHITRQLKLRGIAPIKEDPNSAYCPIALASVPENVKPAILRRQELLINILETAGIRAYDPMNAPMSPDRNPAATPREVYETDAIRIASARFFTGHNILPSTGFGAETEIAISLLRFPVILMDSNRGTRMLPPEALYLQYKNFAIERSLFVDVFKLLKEYEPGLGLVEGKIGLLGFRGTEVVDINSLLQQEFPSLVYQYNPNSQRLIFSVINTELFDQN